MSDGAWEVADLAFPVHGRWTVQVDVRVSDFDLVKLPGRIELE